MTRIRWRIDAAEVSTNNPSDREKRPIRMKKRNAGKELYRELRALTWEQLWAVEVPGFDAATPEVRTERVAVVRAVGVVFSESGPPELAEEVRGWSKSSAATP